MSDRPKSRDWQLEFHDSGLPWRINDLTGRPIVIFSNKATPEEAQIMAAGQEMLAALEAVKAWANEPGADDCWYCYSLPNPAGNKHADGCPMPMVEAALAKVARDGQPVF